MQPIFSTAGAADLRALLGAGRIVLAPGVYDAISALLAQQAGFPAAFVSGSAIAHMQLARPDMGLLSVTELAATVSRIRERVSIPLLVDADSGYGNAINTMRTVRLLERAGADGIQIEDQAPVKSPTRLADRPVIPIGEMMGKLKAALDTRLSSRTVISARTDVMTTGTLDDALERIEAYIGVGADMVFVERLHRASDMQRLVAHVRGRVPILHNCLRPEEDSLSPVELEAMGYSMVLFPTAAALAAANAIAARFRALLERSALPARACERPLTDALSDIVGTAELLIEAKRYGGEKG